jgi:hypothetical protein
MWRRQVGLLRPIPVIAPSRSLYRTRPFAPCALTVEKNRKTLSIPDTPVRRSDAEPMKPAQARRRTMRVIVLVKATEDSEKGFLRTPEGGAFANLPHRLLRNGSSSYSEEPGMEIF